MFVDVWQNLGQVSYKPGVSGTPSDAIQSAINTAAAIWDAIGSSLTVTSLRDGSHASGPCGHYAGNAVDLRINNLTAAQQQQAYSQLQQQLPTGYLVLWEADHFHVQTKGSLCAGGTVITGPDPSGGSDTIVGQDGSGDASSSSGFDLSSLFDPSNGWLLLALGIGLFFLLRR